MTTSVNNNNNNNAIPLILLLLLSSLLNVTNASGPAGPLKTPRGSKFFTRPTPSGPRRGSPGGSYNSRSDESGEMVTDDTSTDQGFLTGSREQQLLTYQTQLGEINATMYQWESALLQYLFSSGHYNPEARPAISPTKPVHVRLDMALLKINDLVEKDQEIVVSGFLKLNWTDDRLVWNKNDFGGIEWMITAANNVWLPDVALINSNDLYAVTRDNRFPVTVTSNGQVLFVPAGKIHARCELDLRLFPFDWQVCNFRFESWVYSAESVSISGYNFTVDPNHYVQNHQWEILDSFVISKEVTYESFNFSRVEFYLYMRRKSLFFVTYAIFPCLALSTLQIFSHMLPFTQAERINFATTTLIAFSVFHVSIVEQMPQSSASIPLLALYVDSLMILIGLSLIECFVMTNWLSKVGLTVPSPVMWYYVVEKWGDYMMLGSNDTYWRRSYLKILERVHARVDTTPPDLNELQRIIVEQQNENETTSPNRRRSVALDRRFSYAERAVLGRMAKRWRYSSVWLEKQDVLAGMPLKTTPPSSESRKGSNSRSPLNGNDGTAEFLLKNNSTNNSNTSANNNNAASPSAQSLNRRGVMPRSIRVMSTASENNSKVMVEENADFTTALTANSTSLFSSMTSDRGCLDGQATICNNKTAQQKNSNVAIDDNTAITVDFVDYGPPASPPPHEGDVEDETRFIFRNNYDEDVWQPVVDKSRSPPLIIGRNISDNSLQSNQIITGEKLLIENNGRKNRRNSSVNTKLLIDNAKLSPPEGVASSRKMSPAWQPRQQNEAAFSRQNSQRLMFCQHATGKTPMGSIAVAGDTTNPQANSQPYRLNANYCADEPHRQLTREVTLTLCEIHSHVGEVANAVSSHELKRECIGVWTTYITVVDRIMSLPLLLLCIGVPTYLFLLHPHPMDISHLKLQQQS